MRRHTIVALRLVCMTCALLGISGLHYVTLSHPPMTVFDTVYAQCILILVSLCYYGIGKFIYNVCNPSKPLPRDSSARFDRAPRDADGNYLNIELTSMTEVVMGAPKLTIQNVWVLVYGAGFVLFVSGYCILGLDRLCLTAYGLGLFTLSLDELICPRTTLNKLYLSARSSVLLTVVISIVLVSCEILYDTLPLIASSMDLYSLFFGICLPVIAQFIMVAIRDCHNFTLGSVVEVCEFGLPFTSFLGIFHLSVAYGQRFQMNVDGPVLGYDTLLNQTWYHDVYAIHVRTDGPFLLFYGLAPFLMIPSVLAYVSCTLEGCSVDPLLTVGLTLCIHYLVEWPASTLGIYGTVCCAVAVVIRVLAEYTPSYPALSLHGDDSHLPHNVVWQRSRNTAAQELTRDLESVPEERGGGDAVTP